MGLLVIVSCSKESTISNKSATDKLNDLGIIPLEQAISTLERFLNESDVSGTKSGNARKISSISTYYSDLTVKSADDSSAIPQAYLINFEDGGGFAVLGANGAVADIVAVTENGAKFSSEDNTNYLFHFNFGWGGNCNGYFSTNCLNPAKGEEYDYQDKWDKEVKKNNFTYSWHFRLITYNVPAN